jgi:hypothetical protein
MKKAWAYFASWHAQAVEATANWIAKKWLWLQSQFDDSINLEFATKYLEDASAQEFQKIASQREAALQEAELQRQALRQANQQDYEKNLADIGAKYESQSQALQNEHDLKMRQAEEELAAARKAWQDALAEAKEKRQAKEATSPEPLQSALTGLDDLLAKKAATISVTGTFNPLEARGLGAGNAADRTATAAEEIARNTRRLVEAAKHGGLTFG